MKDKKTFYGDTNIIIEFATLVHNVPRKSAIKNIQRKYNYPTTQEAEAFVDLYEAVMSGVLTMKVSPVAYQEMTGGLNPDMPEYISKEVGVFFADANIDVTNRKDAIDNRLDKKLVKEFYLTDKFSKSNPAFTYENIRDAYIMADAALDGNILVTLNYYDFTRDGKDLVIKTNNRQFYNSLSPDIRGYVSSDIRDVKPMTPMEYLAFVMDRPYSKKEDCGYTLRYTTKKEKEKIERRKLRKDKEAEVKALMDKLAKDREDVKSVSTSTKPSHASRNYIKGVEDSWKDEYGETPWWEVYEYDSEESETQLVENGQESESQIVNLEQLENTATEVNKKTSSTSAISLQQGVEGGIGENVEEGTLTKLPETQTPPDEQ